jgi:hypothetical protein
MEVVPMTALEYRDMANELRALIPLLIHPKAVADLRSLADQYERLASYLEVLPVSTAVTRHPMRSTRAS